MGPCPVAALFAKKEVPLNKYLKNRSVQDGGVVFLLGAALMVWSFYMKHHAAVQTEWMMSPYLFPIIVSCFALALGLALMFAGKGEVDKAAREGAEEKAAAPIHLKKVFGAILIAIVYYFLMEYLTFLPSTALFLAALMWYMGERRWKVIVPVAILAPLVLFAIFKFGLSVRLP